MPLPPSRPRPPTGHANVSPRNSGSGRSPAPPTRSAGVAPPSGRRTVPTTRSANVPPITTGSGVRPAVPRRTSVRRTFSRNSGGAGDGLVRKIAIYGVFFLVGSVVILFTRMQEKAKDDKEVLAIVQRLLQDIPDYDANKNYYKTLTESAHKQAFESSYIMGDRYRSGDIDHKKYFRILFSAMALQAKADGKKEIAATLDAISERANSL